MANTPEEASHGGTDLRLNGPYLRRAQEALGLSQRDLAKMVGVHASTVGRWLDNENVPATDSFLALCRVLRVSPWIALRQENPENPHAIAATLLRSLGLGPEADTVEQFERLPESDRRPIAERVKGWTEALLSPH